MNTCGDAWGHVATFLLPIDISALCNVRKVTRALLRRVLARVLLGRIRALLPPTLDHATWPAGLCLSGSACWHAMAGEGWKPGDLDLFCPYEQMQAAQVWLERAGFFIQSGGSAHYADYCDNDNLHAIVNFLRWPDDVRRVLMAPAYARKFTELGLNMEGRMWPEGEEGGSWRPPNRLQLVIMQPGGRLNFDLDILLNTYDGRSFVVQRPDLVATRTCAMDVPRLCETAEDVFHDTHRGTRALDRYEKYIQRGITIQRNDLPCPECAEIKRSPERKRKIAIALEWRVDEPDQ